MALFKKNLRFYDIIMAVFAAILLISNLSATKPVEIGPFLLDGGAILFPLAYIIGDVLTEVYGYKFARRAIWTAFGIMIFAVLVFTAVRFLPAAADYTNQAAFDAILGFFPRIVIASLAAFLIGSFVNSYILARLKVRMQGKKLWVRLLGSTFVGEFLDTTVFALVAFAGIFSGSDLIKFILIGWIFKVAVELLLLPVTYRVIKFLKKKEGMDEYDKKTDFNPFKLSV